MRSDMIAMLPERLARGYRDRFRIFELPFEMAPFTITEVWHERTHRDPALVWLRQTLIELLSDGAAAAAPAPRKRAAKPKRR
jgi:DNA-binding transcriptional LysR family regulator